MLAPQRRGLLKVMVGRHMARRKHMFCGPPPFTDPGGAEPHLVPPDLGFRSGNVPEKHLIPEMWTFLCDSSPNTFPKQTNLPFKHQGRLTLESRNLCMTHQTRQEHHPEERVHGHGEPVMTDPSHPPDPWVVRRRTQAAHALRPTALLPPGGLGPPMLFQCGMFPSSI